MTPPPRALAACALLLLALAPLRASSHREAPSITQEPAVDGTDLYLFRSYEPGRENFITIVANYHPLQNPGGGPNYFPLDPDARYEIHIDNDADAREDITFRFRPFSHPRAVGFRLGPDERAVLAPFPILSPIEASGASNTAQNENRGYYLSLIRGARNAEDRTERYVVRSDVKSPQFKIPFDNAGPRTFPDYSGYARQFIYDIDIPGCPTPGKAFVGPRKDPFAANLGELFDLINLAPAQTEPRTSTLDGYNVTSFALEVPIDCLTGGGDTPVIGGWTTAHVPRNRELRTLERGTTIGEALDIATAGSVSSGDFVQVSRLGNPLVNELIIGLPDKNRFNAGQPVDDAQFIQYFLHPPIARIIETLVPGLTAPTHSPRVDLASAFLSGPTPGPIAELLRVDLSVAPVPADLQGSQGDVAGFPNGRRPGDDVVDVVLGVVMGSLCHEDRGLCEPAYAPSGNLPLGDGVSADVLAFDDSFPYLGTPIPGAGNE